jgi:type I restriction enzyme S subunit
VAGNDVDGCIVSDKFPTYSANLELVDPRYLHYYFRTELLWKQALLLSKGAAAISKLTLNPPQFWDLTIPLPDLSEQRQVVVNIEELADKIEAACALRAEASRQSAVAISSWLREFMQRRVELGTLGMVLREKPRNGWSALCDNLDEGTPILTLAAVTGHQYDPTSFKRTSLPTSPEAHYWLQPGDLLITRSNTPELVGHAAIYNGLPENCIYPDLMMRLTVEEDVADKRFVWFWLQSPVVREFIRKNAKGTSPTMKKINQQTVMSIPFPVGISLKEQRQIVQYLDSIQSKVELLRNLQAQTVIELDTLLPSILYKEFRGEQ